MITSACKAHSNIVEPMRLHASKHMLVVEHG